MARIAGILLSLLLFGCATVGVEKVEQLKSGTKLVPLSLMGDRLAIQHIGTIVFENERRDLDVSSWQIDKYTEDAAVRAIGKTGRFSAVAADTTVARKSAGKLRQDIWTGAAVIEGGPESVTRLARDVGADYVLVLGPSPREDPFFLTNQTFSGYGIGQRSLLGLRRAVNFLTMRVVLFDGKDGKEVARTQGFLSSERASVDWMESANLSLSESNAASTRSSLESLIEKVLTKSLSDLKLNQ